MSPRVSSKRDKSYYEHRLREDFPEIYEEFCKGVYSTIKEASFAAGLQKRRTRLHEMKNAWGKASSDEREAFLEWLEDQGVETRDSSSDVVDADHRLTPGARKRIADIMRDRGLSQGQVMEELGFKSLDASLGNALARGTRIRPALARALDEWLDRHPER